MSPRRTAKESPEAERLGWIEISRLYAEFEKLPDPTLVTIESGSLFALDDAIENYNPPSNQVLALIQSASDHIDAFHRLLLADALPAFAGFTILRAAIESAGIAIWLRCSGKANVRVSRSLWLIVDNRKSVGPLAEKLGVENKAGNARMRARVDGIIASRRGLPANLLDARHTTTSMLNEASKHVPKRFFTAHSAWQACSGFTHANLASWLMLSEREELGVSGGSFQTKMTASVSLIAEVLFIAIESLRVAVDYYVRHAAPEPPSHPRRGGR